MDSNTQPAKKGFSRNYWTVILMEFSERGSYYGVMSVLSVYLVLSTKDGGLGFSKEGVGVIKSTITPLLYFLPILAGAVADRYGYRKTLFFAFAVMSTGYFLTSQMTSYSTVFISLVLMAVGAGFFKPIISGTIARETNESNSSLGFGIYYWSINLGAFLVPLLLIPYLKSISWSYIFIMASIGTGWLLLLNLFVFKEPSRPKSSKSIPVVLKEAVLVLKDIRFISMIVIYSGFWILYFQMFDSVLWFLKEHINTAPVDSAVNNFLGHFYANPSWHFDAEHVTVINAATIIGLQLIVSKIVNKFKALPTMVVGMCFGTLGIAMLAVSSNVWVFILGLFVFSIGEMTAHPKFISYVGLIAPPDKKALYLGYSFLYGVIGSGIGGILGAVLYHALVEKDNNSFAFWGIFVLIGMASIIGLLLFNRYVKRNPA